MFTVAMKFADAPASVFRATFATRADAVRFADRAIGMPEVISVSVGPAFR